MSEEWFWETEPRIIINMLKENDRIKLENMKTLALYTASFVWGNNPDDILNKEVVGIDKPATEEQLRAFNF